MSAGRLGATFAGFFLGRLHKERKMAAGDGQAGKKKKPKTNQTRIQKTICPPTVSKK